MARIDIEGRRGRAAVTLTVLALALATPLAAAAAPDAASAKTFIDGLYTTYSKPFNVTWDYVSPAESTVYEPVLVKAMDADSAAHPNGPTSWSDVDILCMCEEYDKVTETTVVGAVAGGHAKATTSVTVMDSGQPHKSVLHFDLVQTGGAWRVYDVGETGYSFRGAVLKDVAAAKKHH
jgi:hypothetical protein